MSYRLVVNGLRVTCEDAKAALRLARAEAERKANAEKQRQGSKPRPVCGVP